MGQQRTEDPEELLRLKEDILKRWERLPPEHQATMLLVLLETLQRWAEETAWEMAKRWDTELVAPDRDGILGKEV